MILLDHNLSPRLVARVRDVFPEAEHVASAGLAEAPDADVWRYARERGLTVVTKDSDFNDLAVLTGPPPHVVWLRRGNCSTAEIEALLRTHASAIVELKGSETAVLLLA